MSETTPYAADCDYCDCCGCGIALEGEPMVVCGYCAHTGGHDCPNWCKCKGGRGMPGWRIVGPLPRPGI